MWEGGGHDHTAVVIQDSVYRKEHTLNGVVIQDRMSVRRKADLTSVIIQNCGFCGIRKREVCVLTAVVIQDDVCVRGRAHPQCCGNSGWRARGKDVPSVLWQFRMACMAGSMCPLPWSFSRVSAGSLHRL